MPSISPEISLKVTNLLKTMGKLTDPVIAEAKKKYDGNGKAPLGILHYLIEDQKVSEDDIVAAISRNYALRKIQELKRQSNPDLDQIEVYEKIVTRSLFGNINASRNSA